MRRTILLVVALAVLATMLTGVLWKLEARHAPTVVAQETGPGSALQQALAALRGWDAARAAAYAEGDVGALGALYVTGSGAGRRDVALLSRYAARGLVVRDLGTQVLRARLLEGDSETWRLVVTERLASGRAVGEGTDLALPQGASRTRTVTLVRAAEGWLVEEVLPGAPGDRSGADGSPEGG
ncbi:hypothetical protein GCM10028867_33980 [Nocardioides pacificus]